MNVVWPVISSTSLASSGAVEPAREPVPPIRPPMARGRYRCFFCIFPPEVFAVEAMKGMNMATRAELLVNMEMIPALRNTSTRNSFSPRRVIRWSTCSN